MKEIIHKMGFIIIKNFFSMKDNKRDCENTMCNITMMDICFPKPIESKTPRVNHVDFG